MRKRKYKEHVIFRDPMFDFGSGNAISSQECTGLIPNAPKTEAEYEGYDDIWHFSPKSANIYRYR